MCKSRARVICMCANPCVIMCFQHLRNHTGGNSFHRLRSFEAYQNQQLIRLAMNTITSIKQHVISASVNELQGQANNQFKKLSFCIKSKQKIQTIQEIIQSNGNVQLKIQQRLEYLAQFKKAVYQMREQMSKDIIDRYCFGLMKIFTLDSFVENKVRKLHEENSTRFAGIIELFINNGIYKGEAENGLPEGRGVYNDPDGTVYDGEFKGGLPEGRVVYKYPDGAVYDGEFRDGKPEGRGVYKHLIGLVLRFKWLFIT